MTKKILKILTDLEDNLRGEHEAICGYYKMLEEVHDINDSAVIKRIKKDVEEIISDELNHTLKLQSLIKALSTIKPAIV
jgi:rubrerythrin